MFGNKKNKQSRLQQIVSLVTESDGITEAELARELGVTRGTINKDMSIVEKQTGALFWQDEDNRIHRYDVKNEDNGSRRA